VLGPAYLSDHYVSIGKLSAVDGSGKATLRPALGEIAHGVVYRLPADELVTLDRIEGLGKGYDRINCSVIHPSGIHPSGPLETVTYIATEPDDRLIPFDWYLALIVAGAREHALPPEAMTRLLSGGAKVDTDIARPARKAAISALCAAGHSDWAGLIAAR